LILEQSDGVSQCELAVVYVHPLSLVGNQQACDCSFVVELLLHLDLCGAADSVTVDKKQPSNSGRILRHSLFAESAMIFAFASSFSLYFSSSLAPNLTLFGCACMRRGSSSFGSAFATAAIVLKPLSQKIRLSKVN
jgi:hypothetical protein